MERLLHNHPDNVNELLSAYIDDSVGLDERRRAATFIETCPACAQEAQELRMFRDLLRDLPNVQPRRSFTLDPATVAPPRRLLFPTLRWASLVATLLFLVVLGVDTLAVGRNADLSFSTASAPGPAQKSDSAGAAGGSAATGGAAETLMLPQASPAASVPEGGQGAAGASAPPLAAEMAPTIASSGATTTAGGADTSARSAGQAVPSYPSAAQTFSSTGPTAIAAAPDMTGNAPTSGMNGVPAGGTTADQMPQPALPANDPAAATTTQLDQTAAEGTWWSSLTLRFAEVMLGLIALLLGIAALWTWRRQM